MTIKTKLFLFVLLPAFMVVGLITLYLFAGNRDAASAQIRQGLTEKSQNYASKVDSLLNQASSVAVTTAQFLSVNEQMSESAMYDVLRRNVGGNRLIYGAAIAFEPGLFAGRKLFSPYVFREGADIKAIDIGTSAYDYTEPQWDWYALPKKQNQALWTEPYFDAGAGNINMITFSVPFRRNGQVGGVTTVDLDLGQLLGLAGIPEVERKLLLIVSPGGRVAYSPNTKDITRPVSDVDVGFSSDSGKPLLADARPGEVLVAVTSTGAPVWVGSATVNATQWRVIVALDPKAALQATDQLGQGALALTLAGLTLTTLTASLLMSRIVRPLGQLADAAKEVASGNLSAPMVRGGNDEVGVLSRNFREMTQRLSAREQELQNQKFALDRHAIVSVVAADGCITHVNDGYCRITGYSAEEVIGKSHLITRPVNFSKDEFRAFYDSVQRGELWQGEMCERARDGSVFWVDVTVVPFMDKAGQLHQYVVIRTDLTARKTAERDLRIAAAAFESQEGVLVTDATGKVLRVNRAFLALSGYLEADVVGRPIERLSAEERAETFVDEVWTRLLQDGSWQGEFWAARKSGGSIPVWLTVTEVRDTGGEGSRYVATVSDMTARKAAQDEIQQLAFYDILTKLPNRRLLLDRLNTALAASARSGNSGALLFIDLDNFKTINDTLGHDVGDLLLCQVAQRLLGCVRKSETVSRLGGDEFVVMLEDLSGIDGDAAVQVETVALKIMQALNQPYNLGGREYQNTPSVGIALFAGQTARVEELMKRADIAMYQAKKTGRNAVRFFDPQMQALVEQRSELELALRQALAHGQLQLYYQVQVDHLGNALGAEVLLRWHHPQRGLVSPANFIPLAEDTGLIVPIGQWVLDTACQQLRAWASVPERAHLQLSVNVSARQFRQPDFCDQVANALQRNGVRASLLKLELTESLVPDNISETIATMQALRVLGVEFSMDDFGTGQSSLSSLKKLPLHQLKIDQSFIRDIAHDPDDAIIVQTIIAMATNLGMEVIAEGVETPLQRDFLIARGCLLFQGYLFGSPMPIAEFERRLDQRSVIAA